MSVRSEIVETSRKIAFVTDYDALDVRTFSGVGHFIARTLEQHVGRVVHLNVGASRVPRLARFRSYAELSPRAVNAMGRRATKLVGADSYDLVFCPGSLPVAALETDVPVALWKDATFASLERAYFTDMNRRTLRHGEQMERAALARASLVFFASDWAAAEAIDRYGLDSGRVRVVPWGANLSEDPGPEAATRTPVAALQLLFVGRPWERKGGPLALGTLTALRRRGVSVELTIVGPVPNGVEGREGVVVHSYFDKRDPAERAQFQGLYEAADFLLFPSRAEAYGVVACEAAAYGVPVVGSDVGGIPTIVRNGETGFTLPLDAGPETYADCIVDALRVDYAGLRIAARKRFETTLNWNAAGQAVGEALAERLGL